MDSNLPLCTATTLDPPTIEWYKCFIYASDEKMSTRLSFSNFSFSICAVSSTPLVVSSNASPHAYVAAVKKVSPTIAHPILSEICCLIHIFPSPTVHTRTNTQSLQNLHRNEFLTSHSKQIPSLIPLSYQHPNLQNHRRHTPPQSASQHT